METKKPALVCLCVGLVSFLIGLISFIIELSSGEFKGYIVLSLLFNSALGGWSSPLMLFGGPFALFGGLCLRFQNAAKECQLRTGFVMLSCSAFAGITVAFMFESMLHSGNHLLTYPHRLPVLIAGFLICGAATLVLLCVYGLRRKQQGGVNGGAVLEVIGGLLCVPIFFMIALIFYGLLNPLF